MEVHSLHDRDMTVTTMEKLKEQGWYLSEAGYRLVSDSENITDIQKIIKRAIDFDLKEISSTQDVNQSNMIVQIQKLRNVAAPKSNEESRSAPRMLKLSLTDGQNNFQAVEVEHISSLSLNTPPGTKMLIKTENLPMSHGIILLRPSHIRNILGGKVASLIEKWELNKKLASHTRTRSTEEGGIPPWIPFGKKIVKISEQDRNFKALAEKEKISKENAEFEAQRKDAIAEAAKQGSKKIFGGGNKQLLDYSVQRIVDQGFSVEQAEYALKINRNNVDRALRTLQQNDSRHNNLREPRNKRFEKKTEDGKPSSGKVSLFDFLEDKLPAQVESLEVNSSQSSNYPYNKNKPDTNSDQFESKGTDQIGKGGRIQRGARSYQAPPRHLEDVKLNKRYNSNNYNTSQCVPHNIGGNSQPNKPPRFQRSQENHNYYQQQDHGSRGGYNRTPHSSDYKNSFVQPRLDSGSINESGNDYSRNQQGITVNSNKNHPQNEFDVRNRHNYDASYGRHNRAQRDGNHRPLQPNMTDKNYKNQLNRQQPTSVNNNESREAVGSNGHKNESRLNNQTTNNLTEGSWVWQSGDKCMAKYWEDNRYYNAEVTAVSERTCVVQFKDFHNFEEVLQVDCIPITEDNQEGGQGDVRECGRQDQYFENKQPRYNQSYNHIGTEFRRGGNRGGSGSKGYNRRRGQQRSTQPIYQPPAQRNHISLPPTTQNNPTL